MKTPSIKTLSAVFTDAKEAKRILQMTRKELIETDAGFKRLTNCTHAPKTYDLRLSVLDSIEPGLFGVEAVQSNNGEYADYLNAGDTYNPTLIYWKGNYRVQALGDFIETMQRQGIEFK